MYADKINTPIGELYIKANDNFITQTYFDSEGDTNITICSSPLLELAKFELIEYFEGKRKSFSFNTMQEKGTEFMHEVWLELTKIPYGETRTYKDIAIKVGRDKAFRAVGNANNKNAIGVIIPCHRVIGSNNKMVGYAGGIYRKEFLLKLEKDNI